MYMDIQKQQQYHHKSGCLLPVNLIKNTNLILIHRDQNGFSPYSINKETTLRSTKTQWFLILEGNVFCVELITAVELKSDNKISEKSLYVCC